MTFRPFYAYRGQSLRMLTLYCRESNQRSQQPTYNRNSAQSGTVYTRKNVVKGAATVGK